MSRRFAGARAIEREESTCRPITSRQGITASRLSACARRPRTAVRMPSRTVGSRKSSAAQLSLPGARRNSSDDWPRKRGRSATSIGRRSRQSGGAGAPAGSGGDGADRRRGGTSRSRGCPSRGDRCGARNRRSARGDTRQHAGRGGDAAHPPRDTGHEQARVQLASSEAGALTASRSRAADLPLGVAEYVRRVQDDARAAVVTLDLRDCRSGAGDRAPTAAVYYCDLSLAPVDETETSRVYAPGRTVVRREGPLDRGRLTRPRQGL